MRKLLLAFAAVLVLGVVPGSALAATATIEGHVLPLSVASEVEVCLVLTGPNAEDCAAVRSDGSYRLIGVPEGTPEHVVFLPSHRSGYVKQYYNHAAQLGEAQTVVTSSLSPATGINATLVAGGTMFGTVTAAVGGQPLAEAEVCAIAVGTGVAAGCAATNDAGNYILTAIPTGSYAVLFRGDGSSAAYAPEYYLNQPDRAHATTVSVTSGEFTEGIDAELDLGARIEGHVTSAANGAGLEGSTVCLFASAAGGAQQCTASLSGGAYAFQGLLSGQYTVGFNLGQAEIAGADSNGTVVGGFLPQFYGGGATRAAAQTISLLAPATATGIDASLATPPAPPAPPAPIVVPPPLTAPPAIAVPPTKKGCKKGFHKKKAKGKTRCVKNQPKKKKGAGKKKQGGGKKKGAAKK